MNRQTGTLAALVLLAAAAPGLAAAQAPDAGPQRASFAAAASRLEGEGLRIIEMERERGENLIEVKAFDRDGRQVRVLLDGTSGDVVWRGARRDRQGDRH